MKIPAGDLIEALPPQLAPLVDAATTLAGGGPRGDGLLTQEMLPEVRAADVFADCGRPETTASPDSTRLPRRTVAPSRIIIPSFLSVPGL